MAKRSAMGQVLKAMEASNRQAQQARAKQERARQTAARQAERDQAQRAKQMAAADKAKYQAQRASDASQLTADLQDRTQALLSILAVGLEADSFIDLTSFLSKPEYPPFPRPDLRKSIAQPQPLVSPPEPVYQEPPAPGLFRKKKHIEAVAAQQEAHAHALQAWNDDVAALPTAQLRQLIEHQAQEEARIEQLASVESDYSNLCAEIDRQIELGNAQILEAVAGLESGEESAVADFMRMVLESSPYPDDFFVEYLSSYDAGGKELTVQALVPLPETLPSEKEFRYNKSKDEITSTTQTQKALKDLYLAAVLQVGLRVLHDVVEADRQDNVETIALTVVTEGIDPATGLNLVTPLIVAAVAKSTLQTLDQANVEPQATLAHLNALVSKNPFGRVPVAASRGVREAKG